ncbi:MAG: glycosyltransferase family 2 protein, partial [Fibrobacteres bacterium]|nr:glycosyltransferase family 2 protein [Fibrobacterota bacterium]
MSSKPSISVIIPTLNRSLALQKTVNCLLKSTVKDFECIIVDQTPGAADNDPRLIDSRIKYIHQSKASLPLARNRGVKLSQADIILFLDDDIEFGSNLLYEHICAHVRSSTAAAVTGRIKLLPPHFYTGGDILAKVEPKSAKFVVNFDQDKRQESDFISGGNVSVKREVFSEVGFFDRMYKGNALYEEIDMSMRIRRAGKTILFHPTAEITHLRAEEG